MHSTSQLFYFLQLRHPSPKLRHRISRPKNRRRNRNHRRPRLQHQRSRSQRDPSSRRQNPIRPSSRTQPPHALRPNRSLVGLLGRSRYKPAPRPNNPPAPQESPAAVPRCPQTSPRSDQVPAAAEPPREPYRRHPHARHQNQPGQPDQPDHRELASHSQPGSTALRNSASASSSASEPVLLRYSISVMPASASDPPSRRRNSARPVEGILEESRIG